MSNARMGEQLVGVYHKLINECDFVSYNVFSEKVGEQMEIDVLAMKTKNGQQQVFICEIVTHLDGIHYGGTPKDDYWTEFGSTSYQGTLDNIYRKFLVDYQYANRVFDESDEYIYQLWAPYVANGGLTDGLEKMVTRFRDERDAELVLKINDDYATEIDKLREKAASETKQYGEPAFRILQILEHMRR